MLNLLSVHQSVLLILYWHKKIPDPFSTEVLQLITDDNHPLRQEYFINQWFLQNAIETGELPALIKEKTKPEINKLFNAVDIPKDYREFITHYDYWIKFSDLRVFVERPNSLPEDSYAHARDALARVTWMLAKQNLSVTNQTELFEYLAQLVDSMEQEGFQMKLGETTLKGCVREILSAGEVVEKKS